MFAKIFGPDNNQVLVTRTADSNSVPLVAITTEAPMYPGAEKMDLLSVHLPCASPEARDWLFDQVDETRARAELAPWLEINAKNLAAMAVKMGN